MAPPALGVHAHHHAVQFYDEESHLFASVAKFVSEGLVSGQPAVILATAAHRSAIVEELKTRFINVDEARRLGDLVLLDAEETLATFMVGDMPDAALFKDNVGQMLLQTVRGRERVAIRAYGEMVDVLWKQGHPKAAVCLEVLWNDLARTHRFSLLCGYAMRNFHKQTAGYNEICEQHTHVLDLPAPALMLDDAASMRPAQAPDLLSETQPSRVSPTRTRLSP